MKFSFKDHFGITMVLITQLVFTKDCCLGINFR